MGRKSIANIEKKIIKQALKVNFKFGLGGISTRDIAKTLGISEPVIFSHFLTKRGLLNATFKAAYESLPKIIGIPASVQADSDHAQFLHYQEQMTLALKKPHELYFIQAYLYSDYYDQKTVAEAADPFVAQLMNMFTGFPAAITPEDARLFAIQYIDSNLNYLVKIVRGQIVRSEKTDFVYYGTYGYGYVGILGVPGAANPADQNRFFPIKR